ncbi:MAG: PD-(D/E)XK nuclease family protein [Winogradskyella sp.]
MGNFITSVLLDLKNKGYNLEDLYFILPSKRAGVFLKNHLSKITQHPTFVPQILSIEEFVEEISGLKSLNNVDTLFRFYNVYNEVSPKETKESFEAFSRWAQILIQDFNEIDRYHRNPDSIFNYLNAIKEIDHWSINKEQTDLIRSYLQFWKLLKEYYQNFTEQLLNDGQGYQGLIYREAVENLESYIETHAHKNYVFLGFNALNTCESLIVQGLLQSESADIYWDIDKVFLQDNVHDAGLFIRQYLAKWNYYKTQSFNWITSHYADKKDIKIIGVPKLVGQAKYIGQILETISSNDQDLKNTAVILGEENLLIPVLNSIPEHINKVNVTMGLPLKFVPLASLFDQLFNIHKKNTVKYYFKDLVALISHPSIYNLFESNQGNYLNDLLNYIQKNNLVHLSLSQLKNIAHKKTHRLIDLLFSSWNDSSKIALKHCSDLISLIKSNNELNNLDLEYLYRFHSLFNQLSELNNKYGYLDSIVCLYKVYNDLLQTETLDFKGEPLEGLQIMGMLESRVLDFETVIISSVNEGILPSGKTTNSFIPYDVKIENNLPTYKEKDAVYTYHFYRLLQRAKNIYILYNTEIDTLKGGEKSRFITQMEVEGIHELKHIVVSPEVALTNKKLKQITKTNDVLSILKELSGKGFSPSSLTNYIRNPLDFYYEKILGVKDFEDVEENIAANTLGSVIHNTLEDFYKPFEGKLLTLDTLKEFKSQIKPAVTQHFKSLYKDGDFSSGKNLIIFEIAQRYISNFINSEIDQLKDGIQIKILAIESEEKIKLDIKGIPYPIHLTGKVDRIDEFNGVTRIIDYKSGKVEQSKVEIIDWEDITTDYDKYSKSFQVLCYVYMMHQKGKIDLPIEAGIISFKNLNQGFLKFGKKETSNSRKKDQLITKDTLKNFEKQLFTLILEICTPNIDFVEKELD